LKGSKEKGKKKGSAKSSSNDKSNAYEKEKTDESINTSSSQVFKSGSSKNKKVNYILLYIINFFVYNILYIKYIISIKKK